MTNPRSTPRSAPLLPWRGSTRPSTPPSPPPRAGGWRWTVRRHMGPVRDAIEREHLDPADGWLSARHGRSARERAALLAGSRRTGRRCSSTPISTRCATGSSGCWATSTTTSSASTTWPTTRSSWRSAAASSCQPRQRGRDSNPRLTSLPATAFKAVPIGHSGTPPGSDLRAAWPKALPARKPLMRSARPSGSPSWTTSPSATRTAVTVPAASADHGDLHLHRLQEHHDVADVDGVAHLDGHAQHVGHHLGEDLDALFAGHAPKLAQAMT